MRRRGGRALPGSQRRGVRRACHAQLCARWARPPPPIAAHHTPPTSIGDPRRLVYALDSRGLLCGTNNTYRGGVVDLSDRPNLYYLNVRMGGVHGGGIHGYRGGMGTRRIGGMPLHVSCAHTWPGLRPLAGAGAAGPRDDPLRQERVRGGLPDGLPPLRAGRAAVQGGGAVQARAPPCSSGRRAAACGRSRSRH